ALMHTEGAAVVTLRLLTGAERRLRVEVEDSSSALPRRRDAGEAGVSGRGLLLVDMLTDLWGVEARGGGKCVWGEFVVPGRADPDGPHRPRMGHSGRMPELPELEALKDFLTEHLVGHEIVRVLPVAVSVLKTYDPPLSAVEGREVTAVHRYGKFLGLETDGGPHLVTHLARAGWLHWRDPLPSGPPRPGKGPLALRVALETGAGFDLTEAGTQKRLAVYVVADPADVPGVARLGPDPLADDFDEERLAGLLSGERRQLKGALRDQS